MKIDHYVLHTKTPSIPTTHFNASHVNCCKHSMNRSWSCNRTKGHDGPHINCFKDLTNVDHFAIVSADLKTTQNHYLSNDPRVCRHHMHSLRGCTRKTGHEGLHFNCFGDDLEWSDDAGVYVTSQAAWLGMIDALGKPA